MVGGGGGGGGGGPKSDTHRTTVFLSFIPEGSKSFSSLRMVKFEKIISLLCLLFQKKSTHLRFLNFKGRRTPKWAKLRDGGIVNGFQLSYNVAVCWLK